MSDIEVYDKAKWHFQGDRYPASLPEENAYIHGGFLLAWLLKSNLLSASFLADNEASIAEFNEGRMNVGQLNEVAADGVLDSEMLDEQGNGFAEEYISEFYLEDYELLFEDDYEEFYDVPDNAENRQRVESMLDEAYSEWRDEQA